MRDVSQPALLWSILQYLNEAISNQTLNYLNRRKNVRALSQEDSIYPRFILGLGLTNELNVVDDGRQHFSGIRPTK